MFLCKSIARAGLVIGMACFMAACAAHYVTPSGGVSMSEVSDDGLGAYYDAAPASGFPANLAIVRVQQGGYRTKTNRGYGHGRYSVVTARDIEAEAALAKFQSLPLIRGVAPVGRILIPSHVNTLRDLRSPAAQLRADLLLIYTVDTAFTVDGVSLGPLSLVSLGLLPEKKARVTATVAGVLIDVRTGYVYGTTEATAIEEQRANLWSTELVTDSARIAAEEAAFADFADGFQSFWTGVLNAYAHTAPRPVTAAPTAEGYYYVDFERR